MNQAALTDWMHEPARIGINHSRLSYLLVCNGGFDLWGYGAIQTHNGHQRGLLQDEFFDLLYYKGFREGALTCGCDFDKVFRPLFNQYIEQHNLQDEYKREPQ